MKKISLKNLNLKEVERLSRDQLRDILGGGTGSGPGSTTEDCSVACNSQGGSCKTNDCTSGTCVSNGNKLICVAN